MSAHAAPFLRLLAGMGVQAVLRGFQMGNHKSCRGEIELLLIPAYDRKRQVVPVTALYSYPHKQKRILFERHGQEIVR